ncbi:MAG: hypothetical protein JWP92_3811 [Caulobacter sp.]|nr:hypothetical protein [Caulobacter sp.]
MYMLIVYAGWLGLFGTLAFAIWKGDTAERLGAGLNFGLAIVGLLIHLLLPLSWRGIGLLAADFALATGFLLLAMRYASIWLGVAMLFEATQFALHGYYLVADKRHDYTYGLINNINTTAIQVAIVAGVVYAWRKRSRRRQTALDIPA